MTSIEVCAVRDDGDDGFWCFAPELPGVVAQGGTVDEAFTEMRIALGVVLDVYGGVVPWTEPADTVEEGAIVERRLLEFIDDEEEPSAY